MPRAKKQSVENKVRDIRRKTRRKYSAEEKIRIVLEGLRGEETVAELCRREGIAKTLYYSWSKEFLEAGKARLTGDTKRNLIIRFLGGSSESELEVFSALVYEPIKFMLEGMQD